ncbi:hypothetical protein HRR78_000029 [Exophiala dermatitidis]|nr:hypothetical protein HRR75_000936 [Exophiala dermatitidis]KAJ4559509.1 hypothetical protein HRR78_000029 [Exophiala dermatitidis]
MLSTTGNGIPIDIDTLSRTPISRLTKTALPNIGLIELVSTTDFAQFYDPLYTAMFPRRAERERSDLIVERLAAQARGDRVGLAPYRIVGIRDEETGEAIGAAHFSVLPVPPRAKRNNPLLSPEKSEFNSAIPYLQYIYIRPQNRRQDLSEVLHTMVLAVSEADAASGLLDDDDNEGAGYGDRGVGVGVGGGDNGNGVDTIPSATSPVISQHHHYHHNHQQRQQQQQQQRTLRTVPFTLFETEPPDHGDDQISRDYARERSKIHTSTGGLALMLVPEQTAINTTNDNTTTTTITTPTAVTTTTSNINTVDKIISPHVQPGLEKGDPPLSLVWVIRQSPNPGRPYDVNNIAKQLIAAYYQSLRDEGFPLDNIRLAEGMVQERCNYGKARKRALEKLQNIGLGVTETEMLIVSTRPSGKPAYTCSNLQSDVK